MSDNLALRLPDVEWSFRSGEGRLGGLTWVDLALDPDLSSYRLTSPEDHGAFRAFQFLGQLPTWVADQTLLAARRGRPTAWEGLALLFARPEWLVASREHLWAPWTPYPHLLAYLAESFGVGRNLHEDDGERLARLAALLPTWYPSRGRLDKAREVLAACDKAAALDAAREEGDPEADAQLPEEVLCCHGARWWLARQEEEAVPEYRISGGFLKFQSKAGPRFRLRREDLVLGVDPEQRPHVDSFRLLPVWAAVRFTVSPATSPAEPGKTQQ